MEIRDATSRDAEELAYLINLAGEGIPNFLWSQMAENDETPLEVGIRRASREEGGFSYRHAKIIEVDSLVAAMLLGYLQPDPYDVGELAEYPEVVRPLVELEAKAPGSWYINAIATMENFRKRGFASRLMSLAEELAQSLDAKQTSLIVASENIPAVSLYKKLDYQIIASRPVVQYPGSKHGGDWYLMVKSL